MANFAEAFPETGVAGPTPMGTTPLPQTPLTGLRRRQLIDLADAFEIPIDRDAPLPRILPALINAQASGVLDGEPIDKAAFRRAQRSSDQEPLPPLPEEIAAAKAAAVPEQTPRQVAAQSNPMMALKSLCKKRGIKSGVGMTMDDMIKALNNAIDEGETEGEPAGDGQESGHREVGADANRSSEGFGG